MIDCNRYSIGNNGFPLFNLNQTEQASPGGAYFSDPSTEWQLGSHTVGLTVHRAGPICVGHFLLVFYPALKILLRVPQNSPSIYAVRSHNYTRALYIATTVG
jgi:hypothetical protein